MSAVGGNSGYTLKTFYSAAPYMLSANTVWLEPNDSVAPMSNVNFRKAMAYALNPAAIAQTVYGGITAPANPTGLLPGLSSFVNQGVVSADAPSYNTGQGQAVPGRSPATTARPSPCRCRTGGRTGWTPPPSSRTSSQAVGINVDVIYPQANTRTANVDERQLRSAARQQRRRRLHAVELLPAGVRAADRQGPGLPAQLGADQLAGRLVAGAAGGLRPADRHQQAGLDLHPAADRLLRPGAGDPALVQRRLVPGQHLGLVGLPGEHRLATRTCRSCGPATSAR